MCSGSALYEAANYCTDEELLRRRALYEKLERCLWRFSMENGGSGNNKLCGWCSKWDKKTPEQEQGKINFVDTATNKNPTMIGNVLECPQ